MSARTRYALVLSLYWGYIGIMENEMDTTILLGLYEGILHFHVAFENWCSGHTT